LTQGSSLCKQNNYIKGLIGRRDSRVGACALKWSGGVAGGFDTEQEAALAYDVACVRFRGTNAQTNFDIDGYTFELEHIDEVPSHTVLSPHFSRPPASSIPTKDCQVGKDDRLQEQWLFRRSSHI